MINYKEIQKSETVVDSITCDKCGRISSPETDILRLQEWFHYNFIGGYGSVFGDGNEYMIDLCQICTKELLGPYLKYVGNYT
jgi:hypothetical protein